MRRHRGISVLSLLALTVLSSSAMALPPARGELELVPGGVSHPLYGTVTVLSPMFTWVVPLNPETAFFGTLGMTGVIAGEAPEGMPRLRAITANPSLGLSQRLGTGLTARILVTAPLSTRAAWGDELGGLAEEASRGLRGHVDPWLWLSDHFAAVGSVTWVLPVGRFLFEVQPSVALMLPTRRLSVATPIGGDDGTAPPPPEAVDRGQGFAVQVRARAGVLLWEGLWFIVGGNFVWTPTVTRDADQWSLAPELRWAFEDGSHVAASGLINIDGPWGPSFGDGYFGFRLSGGWRF